MVKQLLTLACMILVSATMSFPQTASSGSTQDSGITAVGFGDNYLFSSVRVFVVCWDYRAPAHCSSSATWQAQNLDMEMVGNPISNFDTAKSARPYLQGIIYTTVFYTSSENVNGTENGRDTYWRAIDAYATANGLNVEDFYLHAANPFPGCARPAATKTCRYAITTYGTSGEDQFLNIGNANVQAFILGRLKDLSSGGCAKCSGWFFDTNSAQAMYTWVCGNGSRHNYLYGYNINAATLEYGSTCSRYFTAYVALMTALKAGVSGPMVPNIGFTSGNPDPNVDITSRKIAKALGWDYPEGSNNIFTKYVDLWPHVDDYVVTDGDSMIFSTRGFSDQATFWNTFPGTLASFTRGNYDTDLHRYQMSTLVQHFMLQPTGNLLRRWIFGVQSEGTLQDLSFNYPHAGVAVNLGIPAGARTQFDPVTGNPTNSTFTDPAGQISTVWRRQFTNGWVIMRPKSAYSAKLYGDTTAQSVTIPAGTWHLLKYDGTTTTVFGTVSLRNTEGVILLK